MTTARRPRVLVITPDYPSEANPATGAFVAEHVRAISLRADPIVVHLAGWRRGVPLRTSVREDDVDGIRVLRASMTKVYPPPLAWPLFSAVAAGHALASGCWGGRADIVHAHVFTAAAPALVLARRLRVPVVITEHSTVFLDADPQQLSWHWRRMSRVVFENSGAVVAVGTKLAEAISRWAPRADVRVIPNAVDVGIFRPGGSLPAAPPYRVRMTALLSPQKRIDVAIDAIASLSAAGLEVHLAIAGGGPLQTTLEEHIRRRGVEHLVELEGMLPRAEIARRVASAHALVVSSDFETFSMATAEALACGTPVVATRCGGPEELIGPSDGVLVPIGDPDALAAAIQDMVTRQPPIDREAIARRASHFSHDEVGQQTVALYEELLRARRP